MADTEQSRKRSVLLIDADVLARHELAGYLRNCGYRVIEASGTDEAVTVLSQSDDEIDALLCEADAVGEMNAFALVRWVRDHRPTLPVMLAGSLEKAAQHAGELCDEGPVARPPLRPGRRRRSHPPPPGHPRPQPRRRQLIRR